LTRAPPRQLTGGSKKAPHAVAFTLLLESTFTSSSPSRSDGGSGLSTRDSSLAWPARWCFHPPPKTNPIKAADATFLKTVRHTTWRQLHYGWRPRPAPDDDSRTQRTSGLGSLGI